MFFASRVRILPAHIDVACSQERRHLLVLFALLATASCASHERLLETDAILSESAGSFVQSQVRTGITASKYSGVQGASSMGVEETLLEMSAETTEAANGVVLVYKMSTPANAFDQVLRLALISAFARVAGVAEIAVTIAFLRANLPQVGTVVGFSVTGVVSTSLHVSMICQHGQHSAFSIAFVRAAAAAGVTVAAPVVSDWEQTTDSPTGATTTDSDPTFDSPTAGGLAAKVVVLVCCQQIGFEPILRDECRGLHVVVAMIKCKTEAPTTEAETTEVSGSPTEAEITEVTGSPTEAETTIWDLTESPTDAEITEVTESPTEAEITEVTE